MIDLFLYYGFLYKFLLFILKSALISGKRKNILYEKEERKYLLMEIKMNKEELAKRIKGRVAMIGTALKHMESIMKYNQNNKGFEYAFVLLYISLQNYVCIELDKIFDGSSKHEFSENNDTGKCIYHSSKYSIYKLIEKMEGNNTNGIYHCSIRKYHNDIMSIRTLRDKYFAHYDGKDLYELIKNNYISDLQGLLKCVAEICCKANPDLLQNTYESNVRDFDDWCHMATNSLNEICILNDKLASASVPKEMYEENLDGFINYLKQMQKGL